MNKLLNILFMFSFATSGMALETLSKEELEKWFYDDTDTSVADVNDGELVFLDKNRVGRTLYSKNLLTVTQQSITTGWVKLQQCYEHLDAVMDMQIVYSYQTLRALEILSFSGIDQAWLDGKSVQMRNVQHDAAICVAAEVQIFRQNQDKSFHLVSGPYHRKFLDGYYPMQVSFQVSYPANALQFLDMQPEPQKGLYVSAIPGVVNIDAYFAGMLTIKQRFMPIVR